MPCFDGTLNYLQFIRVFFVRPYTKGIFVLKKFPKTHLLAAGGLSLAIGSILMFSPSSKVEANRISIPLPLHGEAQTHQGTVTPVYVLPKQDTAAAVADALPAQDDTASLEDENAASDIVVSTDYEDQPHQELVEDTQLTEAEAGQWNSLKIKSGDTLSALFHRAGFSAQDLANVLAADKDKNLRKIYPGDTIEFNSLDGKLNKVRLVRSLLESTVVSRTADGSFKTEVIKRVPEAHPAFGAGTITSSLFAAGQNAGLSQGLIMEMASIFGYDIDFALDLREGDQFNVVYEELYLDGKKIGYGNILAANFTNQGKTYTAVRYTDPNNRTSYYRPTGQSLRKAFIRTPVDFARISSHFNLSRKHPVLNKIRAHKGTDYAAPPGTPIKAAGDGKVIFAGVKGGYGNVVIIQHGQSITTLYAHMQKFAKGIRVGTRVEQSQVIGYVGSSGLATGPHLHYEFQVNGAHKNPTTVKLPEAAPVPQQEMARFKQQTATHLAQLETFAESHRLALNAQ